MISYIYIYTICWQSHMRVVGVAHHQHNDYLQVYVYVYIYIYPYMFVLLYNEPFFLETDRLSVPRYLKIVTSI